MGRLVVKDDPWRDFSSARFADPDLDDATAWELARHDMLVAEAAIARNGMPSVKLIAETLPLALVQALLNARQGRDGWHVDNAPPEVRMDLFSCGLVAARSTLVSGLGPAVRRYLVAAEKAFVSGGEG